LKAINLYIDIFKEFNFYSVLFKGIYYKVIIQDGIKKTGRLKIACRILTDFISIKSFF